MSNQRIDARLHRQQLMDAARHIFAQKGLAGEVKEIAEAAGVGVGTLYRNFPRKDDLVLALLDEAIEQQNAAYDEIEALDTPADAKIRLLLERFFTLVDRYGYLLEALWSGQLPSEWRERRDKKNPDRFRVIVEQGIAAGTFRAGLDPGIATLMLSGPVLFGGLTQQSLDPQTAAEEVMDLFLHGALAPGQQAGEHTG